MPALNAGKILKDKYAKIQMLLHKFCNEITYYNIL